MARYKLRPLKEQVLLITGASSGIGLMTARIAAARRAKVFLVARSEEALQKVTQEIREEGGDADFAVADVASAEAFRAAATKCVERFGKIDTWVNNAGASVYGTIAETNVEDDKRLFDTNFWGVVNGSRLAVEHLRDNGGAIINVGSMVSDRAVPLQGMYSASKHAVQGFTDTLRMEIEESGMPIAVTLIKPAGINTPFIHHAKNYMDREPQYPPPVYEPEVVAEQILYAAQHPVRHLYAGGAAWGFATMAKWAPGLTDLFMRKDTWKRQKSVQPPRGQDGLNHPTNDPQARGDVYGERIVRSHSLYGAVSRHPVLTLAAIGTAGAIGAAIALMPDRRERSRGLFGARGGLFAPHNLARYGKYAAEAVAAVQVPKAVRSAASHVPDYVAPVADAVRKVPQRVRSWWE